MNLSEWAKKWGVPSLAMADLTNQMGLSGHWQTSHPLRPHEGASESRVQSLVRLEAARKGLLLWRNNVGALLDERGVPVRYGLANESKAQNQQLKSADLIGIRPVLIGPEHVGHTIGQFVSREVKEGFWKYTGNGREQAQRAWLELVLSVGGDAAFAAGEGSI